MFSAAFVCLFVRLSVCLFFRAISQNPAAKNTKLDTEMFLRESWKPIYFGIKIKGQGHEAQNPLLSSVFALL